MTPMAGEFTLCSEGTKLYCRRTGEGTPLLMIHGSCVDCDFFSDAAEFLSQKFTVITYDRRGYSRSDMPSDADYSISAQARDAANIINTIGGPCHIFAHSAGAVIAMELVKLYPELLRKVLLFEPPVTQLLPENSEMALRFSEISAMAAKGSYTRAMNHFLSSMGPQDERARPNTKQEVQNALKNSKMFIQHEFDHVFFHHVDLDKLHGADLTVCLGERNLQSEATLVAKGLSENAGCALAYFPGKHNCPYDLPYEFACMLAGLLTINKI